MSDITYSVDAGTLLQGSCPTTYQEMADLFASIYSVTISTINTGIYVSATKPADTTLIWKQLTNVNGSWYPTRDYIQVGGLWISRHTLEPGSIMLWEGDISTIGTFDGGDAGVAGPASGPMWEHVTELAAKFPIGAGTLPSTTVLTVGDTGGVEENPLGAHTHTVGRMEQTSGNDSDDGYFLTGASTKAGAALGIPGELNNPQAGDISTFSGPYFVTSAVNETVVEPNMPPYYALHFIRRTSRQYFAITA